MYIDMRVCMKVLWYVENLDFKYCFKKQVHGIKNVLK